MKYFSLFLLLILMPGCRSGDKGEEKPVVAVTVQRVAVEDVPLEVSAPASLFGRSEAHIAPRITASVRQVLVHKGDAVKKGQLLAVLDRSDLEAEQANATSGVALAEAALEQAQAGHIPDQLSQAHADLTAKSAALDLAKKVHERRQRLFAEGAISGRDLDVSNMSEIQAQADFDAAKTRLELLERQISGADLKIAQSTLAQAKAKHDLATADLNFSELRSPTDGFVTDQTIYAGDMAKPDVPAFTVADLSSAVARAQVNADQAAPVSKGQACEFEQRRNENSPQPPHFGKVTVVNQAVDPARYAVEVWCELPNNDHELKTGVFGSVKVIVGQAHGAIVVPSSAIEFDEGTDRGKIYTVDAQRVAHLLEVVAVHVDDDRVRVLSGLKPGDIVIVQGEYGLPDETKVSFDEVRQ
ncbi:efflux RND transporter periplasmic adaptor subunit [Acidicapsa dinghuensis]|uniref:Efflux RND transporter periplasmic adaptor subunit n=1 Tax=Acidicapsa dinghuensis TaxID=2218256 RepID=A0ABW1EDZ2_9BACT|nr:efflux RND transporter periplasmic adaptor subunit [Acidicapsa dinghuensis]